MRYLESLDLDALAANMNHGEGGPRAFLPILAKYVESGSATIPRCRRHPRTTDRDCASDNRTAQRTVREPSLMGFTISARAGR